MTLLGLRLHWGFIVSYLDPKALWRALLSVVGCQVIVPGGWGIRSRDILFGHFADLTTRGALLSLGPV